MELYKYSTDYGKTWSSFKTNDNLKNTKLLWKMLKTNQGTISVLCDIDTGMPTVVIDYQRNMEDMADDSLRLYVGGIHEYHSPIVKIFLSDYQEITDDDKEVFTTEDEDELIKRIQLAIEYLALEYQEVLYHLGILTK